MKTNRSTTNEVPRFRPAHGLMDDLPARSEMLEALKHAVSACIFKAQTLLEEDSTVAREGGGIDVQAAHIETALRTGAMLTRMYEALSPLEEIDRDEEPEFQEAQS